MSGYDELRDKYEDAMFAYLMESVKMAEGHAAVEENERLKMDPSAAVPSSLDDKCLKIINQGYRNGKFRRSGQKTLRLVSRIAIVAAILMLSFVVAFAVSPTIRTATTNWIVNTFKDRTEVTSTIKPGEDQAFRDDDGNLLMSGLTLQANWIPEGFSLTKEGENNGAKWLNYKSKSGDRLEAELIYVAGGTDLLDTEDSSISFIDISGHEATVLSKNGQESHIVVWILEEYGAHVVIYGEGVSEETTIQFAQNLIIE
jgi:hypothetical protein